MTRPDANERYTVEVVTEVRRRRWSTQEKMRIVEESFHPGLSVSYVARGVAPVSTGHLGIPKR
ncbi:transposase [Oceanidesulfovibrio marinus]|uniref:Transposase n=1 Tax=Oceanidesulfovibrio marinus TaxID=370038 RepID=A0ABX6NCP5_9BACT|nr:hypothetical protein E8L03_05240 [Oceanidesulfovibrio marinus]